MPSCSVEAPPAAESLAEVVTRAGRPKSLEGRYVVHRPTGLTFQLARVWRGRGGTLFVQERTPDGSGAIVLAADCELLRPAGPKRSLWFRRPRSLAKPRKFIRPSGIAGQVWP